MTSNVPQSLINKRIEAPMMPTNQDTGLSYMYSLKGHIERVLGHTEFLKIKEYAPVSVWTTVLKRLISCYGKAIGQSITIRPKEFATSTAQIIERTIGGLTRPHQNIDSLLAEMVARQSELILTLLGQVDDQSPDTRRTLSSSWDLSKYRTTQIVQTEEQRLKYIQDVARLHFSRQEIDHLSEKYRSTSRFHKETFWEWILKRHRLI